MICSKCGATLAEGSVFCSRCGQEVEIVTAFDDLEEELLREQLRDDKVPAPVPDPSVERRAAAERARKEKQKKKEKRMRLLILLLVIAAAIVVVAVVAVRVSHNHSTDYLLDKAFEEYDRREYDEALGYLDKLFALDEENEEGLLLSARVYMALYDYENAEHDFLRVIASDPDCAEAYEGILAVYAAQGKTDEIYALRSTVTGDDILALFDSYVTPSPEILLESGSYDDYLSVEIRAPESGLFIYYTLDGTTPTTSSPLYSGPVKVEEQGHIVLNAVCADTEGNLSDPVTAEYEITLIKPDMPTASPDGGQFSSAASVTVTAPAGTTVYYTWDNTTPTTNSSVYSGPITVKEGNNVLSLIAVDERGMVSDVLKCNYIYYPQTTSQTLDDEAGE